MKKIKEGEEFQLGSQVFTYSINESGGVVIKVVNKPSKSKTTQKANPTIQEVKDFFKSKGYSEESAIKFHEYYDVAGWKDAKGNPVKNYKQKAMAVWFVDKNKIQEKPQKESKDPKFLF